MIRPVRSLAFVTLLLAGVATAKDHHEHGAASRLFISPMGEPFRSGLDGDPEAAWFASADTNHDGRISLAEFQADAHRWFLVADRGHDGEIDPDDIDYYENRLVPEIRVADAPRADARPAATGKGRGGRGGMGGRGGGMGGGGMGGGGMGGGGMGGSHHNGNGSGMGDQSDRPAVVRATRQGVARFSYLDFPEPLTAADANMNRGIDAGEMARAAAERFAKLDKNGDGYLERRELPRVDTRTSGPGPRPGGPHPDGSPPSDSDRQLGGGDREQD
jgi:hypothetical protein